MATPSAFHTYIAKVEGVLSSLKASLASGVTKLEHSFLTNAKGWIAILGIIAIVVMHKYGIDSAIVTIAYNVLLILLVLHYVGQYIVDICNCRIECYRIRYLQKDDGVPGAITADGTAASAALTTLIDKGAAKPPPAGGAGVQLPPGG